ncbi:M23 family metallopeptidase [Thioflexithrix psekupsensis]|uniref:M23ase beta-sheet core domain-containing protein n=1 Tax=Thioflexithrix psekupsensis TaxID=1570016 RepID=A0A251X7M2_9GAMM|nr:M23 family metallopeptidase [Thioflexithrix psekupsensis]OUD13935.1 hypothetical protein TPSD3_06220 [Thioflexithrix psekupsensis]
MMMFFLRLLLLGAIFSFSSGFAAEITAVTFEQSRIVIRHTGCQAQSLVREEQRLILSFTACQATEGRLLLLDKAITNLHWLSDDSQRAQVIIQFALAQDYAFEIDEQENLYQICFPRCHNLLKQQSELNLNALNQLEKMTLPTLFTLQNKTFLMPLPNMRIEDFLDRSIGYVPQDVVRDGLPHFGSKRDDWLGKSRPHLGYDIYVDNVPVFVMADGVVIRATHSRLSGAYVKVHHGNQLYTVYVHLKDIAVQEGQTLQQGDIVGYIRGPAGNAVEAQLHLEVKINDMSTDPLPLIKDYYQNQAQILQKITHYESLLPQLIRGREQKVREFLEQNGAR